MRSRFPAKRHEAEEHNGFLGSLAMLKLFDNGIAYRVNTLLWYVSITKVTKCLVEGFVIMPEPVVPTQNNVSRRFSRANF
jgi:hypothetical protein